MKKQKLSPSRLWLTLTILGTALVAGGCAYKGKRQLTPTPAPNPGSPATASALTTDQPVTAFTLTKAELIGDYKPIPSSSLHYQPFYSISDDANNVGSILITKIIGLKEIGNSTLDALKADADKSNFCFAQDTLQVKAIDTDGAYEAKVDFTKVAASSYRSKSCDSVDPDPENKDKKKLGEELSMPGDSGTYVLNLGLRASQDLNVSTQDENNVVKWSEDVMQVEKKIDKTGKGGGKRIPIDHKHPRWKKKKLEALGRVAGGSQINSNVQ